MKKRGSDCFECEIDMDDLLKSVDARGVATVTLNRPERHNAFDDVLVAHLTSTLRSLDKDDEVRLVAIAGAGPSFCAGGDIEWLRRAAKRSSEENEEEAAALFEMFRTLHGLTKPTIALINGAAYGGGVGLVACCDIAIAAADASFCLSEVRLGLIPATVGPFVIRSIGARQARRFFLTAERVTAEQALAIGLVHLVTEENHLSAASNQIISALLQGAPGAQADAKSLIAFCESQPIDDELREDTSRRLAERRASIEGQEGLSAFLSKRPASWAPVSDMP
jgi:methylglutaconyl-CoA hydratase